MISVKPIVAAAALGVAMLGSGLSAFPAQATYVVSLVQQDGNVVATGGGTIDLTALTRIAGGDVGSAFIDPSLGEIDTGPVPAVLTTVYNGFTGPSRFGPGNGTTGNAGSGDPVGIVGLFGQLYVPRGYVSKAHLADTTTYDNATFASLGATPGTYVWTWGSGATADSFRLNVGGVPVPEPSSLRLLALPLGLFMLLGARHRRAARAA